MACVSRNVLTSTRECVCFLFHLGLSTSRVTLAALLLEAEEAEEARAPVQPCRASLSSQGSETSQFASRGFAGRLKH